MTEKSEEKEIILYCPLLTIANATFEPKFSSLISNPKDYQLKQNPLVKCITINCTLYDTVTKRCTLALIPYLLKGIIKVLKKSK